MRTKRFFCVRMTQKFWRENCVRIVVMQPRTRKLSVWEEIVTRVFWPFNMRRTVTNWGCLRTKNSSFLRVELTILYLFCRLPFCTKTASEATAKKWSLKWVRKKNLRPRFTLVRRLTIDCSLFVRLECECDFFFSITRKKWLIIKSAPKRDQTLR